MPKVSVIIPIYNAQDYLERCLDSVCNQTLKDIEIICVNDASTDKSIDILNKYAQRYQNMKVIDCKINGGESVARNIGMENATGEYLGFVDNDDEIDVDFYEKLYNKATEKNADISKGEVHIVDYDQKETYGNLNKKIRENNEILFFAYHWWTAIFKTSIIKDNHIEFIPKYPLGGDVLFLNKVVLASNSIALVDDAFYHYYRRENSGDSKILTFEKITSVLYCHEMIVDNVLQFPIAAVPEAFGCNPLNKTMFGISDTHKYFSSGNLIIDCNLWRKNNIIQKIREIEKRYRNVLKFADMEILNILFQDSYKELEPKYCYINQNYFFPDIPKDIFIRHYNGAIKPWHINFENNVINDVGLFWHYAKITMFYHELVDNCKNVDKNFILRQLKVYEMVNKAQARKRLISG